MPLPSAQRARYRADVEFRLLGPLEVLEGERPLPLGGPKQRAVLAHLLLHAGEVVSTDRLIEDVWGEDAPPAVRGSLQAYVSRLRRLLGADRLEGRPPGYVFHAAEDQVDALRFEALLRRGHRLLQGDPRAAAEVLRDALALWRGPPLADLGDGLALSAAASRLEELRLSGLEDRIGADLALGSHAELVAELEALTEKHPLRERFWSQRMLALYRSGRQGEALEAYRRAREILAEDLGVDPSPDLQRLHVQILNHDPALEAIGEPLRGYRLLERIGQGTFGVVHRAIQPQVGREVAVKVIHPHLAGHPEFIRRFEAEAQLVARLEHPHVVPLYDYWREPRGAFLIMRWLRGGSLQAALGDGPLDADRAAAIVQQVGSALTAAHREGVVHRDVKPSNVLLDAEGNAYLSDFGIAEELLAEDDLGLTARGSSPYLSPEQRRGQPSTPRSDLYGLGAVLFEALTGEPPSMSGPALRELRPDLGPEIGDVVARALAEDPADRFAHAEEFAAAVTRALGRAPEAVLAAGPNPYKGLRPFVEADAADYFGREAVTEQLLERLAHTRLLTVVGPSGSGKSSVVRAGVVPALRGAGVPGIPVSFVVEMAPGTDPLAALETALQRVAIDPPPNLRELLERDPSGLRSILERVLPSDGPELVLVVDQFEELFTLVPEEVRRIAFLSALEAALEEPGSRLRVVLTLRADFYDRPLRYRSFAEILRTGTEPLIPMSAEELERAISGPANRVGVAVEPALSARMVADVADQSGALPMLQYALTEMFDQPEGLTVASYQAIGGVSGALVRRADDLYERLGEEARGAARQVFLRLVTLGKGSEDTRRRVPLSELASLEVGGAAVEEVVETFGAHRLLSFDRDPETREPTVEVAHESLLRTWGRLRDWIEAAREDLRSGARFARAAREWDQSGRDPSYLLQGPRLVQAELWRSASDLALASVERDYLEASLAERDARRVEEEARAARERALERRSVTRLRAFVALLTVAALVAAGLSVFAFDQRSRAEREARLATARELAAAARANLDVDPDLSIHLAMGAVEATRRTDGIVLREAEEALHEAVQASRVVFRLPGVGGVAWSADGRLIATAPREGVTIWNAEDGSQILRLPVRGPAPLAFSPDGRALAVGDRGGRVVAWSTTTGAQTATFLGAGASVGAVAFSPDGKLLAGMTFEDQAVVWDASTGGLVMGVPAGDGIGLAFGPDSRTLAVPVGSGTQVHEVPSGLRRTRLPGDGRNVAFSPNGSLIATTGLNGVASVWTARTGARRFELVGHEGHVNPVTFSLDGSVVATGGNDGTVRIWAVEDGTEVLVIQGQQASVDTLAFSPDGSRLASGGSTGTLVWDVTPSGSREVLTVLAPGAGLNVAYSPEGRRIATGSEGSSVAEVRDATTGELLVRLEGHEGPVSDIVFSPDGRHIGTASFDGTAKLWDADGRELRTFRGHTAPAWAVSFDPDGRLLATVSEDGTGRIWEVATGRTLTVLRGHTAQVYDGAFSPDGTTLATVSNDFTARIWDARSGKEITTLEGHDENVVEQAWSPDGRRLATAGFDGTARVWDVRSGKEALTLRGHGSIVLDVESSPDGSRWATASLDGTVRLWDARTGRELLTLGASGVPLVRLAYSPDGRHLAALPFDGTIRVFALDVDELLQLARGRVSRPLTNAECRQYLHIDSCGEAR